MFFQYNVSLASCGNEEVEGQKALMMPIFSKQGLTFNNVSFLCPLSNNKTPPNPPSHPPQSPLLMSLLLFECVKKIATADDEMLEIHAYLEKYF